MHIFEPQLAGSGGKASYGKDPFLGDHPFSGLVELSLCTFYESSANSTVDFWIFGKPAKF